MITEFLSISVDPLGLSRRLVRIGGPGRTEDLGPLGVHSTSFEGGMVSSGSPDRHLLIGSDAEERSTLYSLRYAGAPRLDRVADLGNRFYGGFTRAGCDFYALVLTPEGESIVKCWQEGTAPEIVASLGEGFGGGIAYQELDGCLYVIIHRLYSGPRLCQIRLDADGHPQSVKDLPFSLGQSRYSGLCFDPGGNCFYAIRSVPYGQSFLVQFDPRRRWMQDLFAIGEGYAGAALLPLQSRLMLRVA